jgi:broad specificity phosphatase PhoE
VHVTDIERLIPLERAAETERAKLAGLIGDEYQTQWQAWFKASATVQAAITEHAAESGENQYEVEQAVKKAVRHAEQDPAE